MCDTFWVLTLYNPIDLFLQMENIAKMLHLVPNRTCTVGHNVAGNLAHSNSPVLTVNVLPSVALHSPFNIISGSIKSRSTELFISQATQIKFLYHTCRPQTHIKKYGAHLNSCGRNDETIICWFCNCSDENQYFLKL